MRTRRVGSVTCGGLMVFFGILFLVHMFYPPLSLGLIMKLWPLILVSLGCEMIAATLRQPEGKGMVLQYDKGAVFLLVLLGCFAAGMGVLECFMDYAVRYGRVYL